MDDVVLVGGRSYLPDVHHREIAARAVRLGERDLAHVLREVQLHGVVHGSRRDRGETNSVPLDDLFRWGDGDAKASVLTSAHFIGKEQIAGQTANHYAFRQPGRDWQIWIADGPRPAPLRISIVASNDVARPEFQADLAWNTAPKFVPATFAFAPPSNARAIP